MAKRNEELFERESTIKKGIQKGEGVLTWLQLRR